MRVVSLLFLAATAATALAKKLKDNKKWSYKAKGIKYKCDHVALRPAKRCARIGKKKKTAKDACAKTCDKYTCSEYGGKDVGSCEEGSGSGSDSESGSGGVFKADDKTIYEAAKLWFEDEAAAKREYGDMSTWDTSEVTTMDYLLGACWSDDRCPASWYSEIPDISNWDTSKVTSMHFMFRDIETWDGGNIGKWDTKKVTSMQAMFEGCSEFNADISGWDTRNVENMKEMFEEASSFNQPIGKWDVSKVKYMHYMLMDASSFNQPLNKWDVGKVVTMNRMLTNAGKFNQPLDKWQLKKIKEIKYMLQGASKFDQTLGWCVDGVNTNQAFAGTKCSNNDCGVDPDC